jgi:hypothetical protein
VSGAAAARSGWLDLFKTLLVAGMIATHVIQLISMQLPGWTDGFAEFVNLVTLSGFMFAFGIGVGLSRGGQRPLAIRLRPVLMLLLAAWLSSFAFALLVDRERLTGTLVLDVLTMRRLFGWSEFLASFFVLYLLLAVARPLFIAAALRPLLLVLVTGLCFASTWFTLDQGWPLTATVIGTTRFASFPLLAYLPWFLFGIGVGRDGIRWWHWLWAAAATAWLVASLLQGSGLPMRFPPSVLWVMGPALLLLLYLGLARWLAWLFTVPRWVTVPGRHVLSYLLVSNLMIFAARRLWGRPVDEAWVWLGVTAAILALIGVAWLVLEAIPAKRGDVPARA